MDMSSLPFVLLVSMSLPVVFIIGYAGLTLSTHAIRTRPHAPSAWLGRDLR
jgi:hypothetical protein